MRNIHIPTLLHVKYNFDLFKEDKKDSFIHIWLENKISNMQSNSKLVEKSQRIDNLLNKKVIKLPFGIRILY